MSIGFIKPNVSYYHAQPVTEKVCINNPLLSLISIYFISEVLSSLTNLILNFIQFRLINKSDL